MAINVSISTSTVFQFQTGSIRSLSEDYTLAIDAEFQFQTGSIRRSPNVISLTGHEKSFNSKLVRLEVMPVSLQIIPIPMFQFQTGSIRSSTFAKSVCTSTSVSIPNWFD